MALDREKLLAPPKRWLAAALRRPELRSRLDKLLAAADANELPADPSPEPTQVPGPGQTDPHRYAEETSFNGATLPVVHLESEEDFAWMERRIVDDGYYESEGIWSFDVDIDKRAIAWMVHTLCGDGGRVLDVGSANGPTVAAMNFLGLDAVGIDISRFAIDNAIPDVADRLILGDVLEHDFEDTFDVILALDVLEHVSPYNVPKYLHRIHALLRPGGKAFFNIPVWGEDPVWGTIFPLGPCTFHHAFPSWTADHADSQPYRTLPVDEDGYPVLGHLVWAGTDWWMEQFSAADLLRIEAIERALHAPVDWFFNITSIARRSFYVLGRTGDDHDTAAIVERIQKENPDSAFFPSA